MQPSLPIGTVLQNRYRLLSVLGQGGFGRTYLAEDLGRFNEQCALKEFSPLGGSDYALNKSKELFQREAATLYQIQHPQIPLFQATFEADQRLFLVQDYVEGKTYRALLTERKAQGGTFSEAEVLQLVQQLLPVLAHIHGKGIIHRDIAPDNIIFRQRDQLPVLIDFGVVKEVATRLHASDTVTQATTVGKMGYAPSEQMQTGRAYPSSDLYALAVTAVVLLTGREPQELYDDQTLTWHWQRWASVSPRFAQVLNRMLNYRPGDRYQSAAEVIQALQPPASPSSTQAIAGGRPTASMRPGAPSQAASSSPGRNVSRMQTVAVGQRPGPSAYPVAGSAGEVRRSTPVISPAPANEGTLWENPFALILTTIGLATVSGIAAWAIVSAVLNSSQPESAEPASPIPEVVSPLPSPEPSSEPQEPQEPQEFSDRLNLEPTGEYFPVEGNLQARQAFNYYLTVGDGQTLLVELEQGEVVLGIFTADGQPVDEQSDRFRSFWQGVLNNGEYIIRVQPRRGVQDTFYRFSVGLQAPAAVEEPPPSPDLTPTPEPTPSPEEPVVDIQPLNVLVGAPIEFPGQASDRVVRRYLVPVRAGQELYVQVLQGDVSLDIRYPDGRFTEGGGGVSGWQQQVSEGGEYQIDVIATQPSNFVLQVGLNEPLPTP
ncbi:MAG: hypothetical protein Kow00121_08150 [Elainellaceae cyanobacterium]